MGESDHPSRISVHQALGGGSVADFLLWRRWCGAAVCLVSASSLWFLFERAGYNLLSFVANVVLLLVVILFLWAKSASILNSLFNFLTLVYIGVVLSLSVPVLYDKYQDHIDDKLRVTHRVVQTQFKKIDDNILRKIPMPINMGKKTQ
ncbi:Reticulon-like protein B11 [Vitis vinifera]|uniref:Reticulon-like protein n=1 Tax=Vitis vinifera TaxID=29760 RepID=A0A438EPQ5_VITVI|nr:Reticulon-like protein B11 [Vitis vinifera]